MASQHKFLRRYTNLADAIHILKSKQMELREPHRWEDKNDWHYIKMYQKARKIRAVWALCFTSSAETYHHWRLYAPGYDGICFRLKRDEFVAAAKRSLPGLKADFVDYKLLRDVRDDPPPTVKWPFIKRRAFKGENEFRLVYSPLLRPERCFSNGSPIVTLDVQAIDKVILSPWLHKSLATDLAQVLRDVSGNQNLQVEPSQLMDYKPFQNVVGIDDEELD